MWHFIWVNAVFQSTHLQSVQQSKLPLKGLVIKFENLHPFPKCLTLEALVIKFENLLRNIDEHVMLYGYANYFWCRTLLDANHKGVAFDI